MSKPAVSPFVFDNTFVRDLPGLFEPWQPAGARHPTLLALNEPLAVELGVDPDLLRTDAGVAMLVGNAVPAGATPVAQAYAGHQFGGYSPRLGDGRALLLGEVVGVDDRRRDLHLKGSGRTPFARGGDGRAAVGPMLREYLLGEAMHALGIPTTRALAVVATGEDVVRETVLPGAVLVRVAASHVRIGTFQYAAATGDAALVQRLADHTIVRHHPAACEAEHPYLALLAGVIEAQAVLVARWMNVGFVHGVLNTDNVTISGETIDYGPCAFMEAVDPATVFSSIDHGGRYAYGNQPQVTMWNLARLAEALLPLVADDNDRAVTMVTDVLQTFPARYAIHRAEGMHAKLGLCSEQLDDDRLFDDLLAIWHQHNVDYTSGFRALSSTVQGYAEPLRSMVRDSPQFDAWVLRWQTRLTAEGGAPGAIAQAIDGVNPVYVPRNHLVEHALSAATAGDLTPFQRLLDVVCRPFEERTGLEDYAAPAPADFGPYRTFCGT